MSKEVAHYSEHKPSLSMIPAQFTSTTALSFVLLSLRASSIWHHLLDNAVPTAMLTLHSRNVQQQLWVIWIASQGVLRWLRALRPWFEHIPAAAVHVLV